MKIIFKNFTKDDIDQYYIWCDKPHVKEKWFRVGYEPKKEILKKLDGANDSVPFVIVINDKPVGYIQYYHVEGSEGSVGLDIFIGEESYVGKGYGNKVVSAFTDKLFALSGVDRVVVDPFVDDKRAIRCYEKAGFKFLACEKDHTGAKVYVMEKH